MKIGVRYYPSYMVPHRGLSEEVKFDELPDGSEAFVARRVDNAFYLEDIKQLEDGTCIVKMDSKLHDETFERIPNLSMTMLRQNHPLLSAKYHLEMKHKVDNWDGRTVKPWLFKNKALLIDDSFLMVYRLSFLHNKPAKYQRRFDGISLAKQVKDNYKDLKEDLKKGIFEKSKYYEGMGHIYLKHVPTMLNYWHCELRLVNADGDPIINVKQGGDKRNMKPSFVEFVWNHFLNKLFQVDKNSCEDIPEKFFYDKDYCSLDRWAAEIMKHILFASVPIVRV